MCEEDFGCTTTSYNWFDVSFSWGRWGRILHSNNGRGNCWLLTSPKLIIIGTFYSVQSNQAIFFLLIFFNPWIFFFVFLSFAFYTINIHLVHIWVYVQSVAREWRQTCAAIAGTNYATMRVQYCRMRKNIRRFVPPGMISFNRSTISCHLMCRLPIGVDHFIRFV